MNVLAIEGEPKGIRVNAIAPLATTRMTESIFDSEATAMMRPEAITAAALFLVSRDAPTKTVLGVGAGVYATAEMHEAPGVVLLPGDQTVDGIAAHWQEIATGPGTAVANMTAQLRRYLALARSARSESEVHRRAGHDGAAAAASSPRAR